MFFNDPDTLSEQIFNLCQLLADFESHENGLINSIQADEDKIRLLNVLGELESKRCSAENRSKQRSVEVYRLQKQLDTAEDAKKRLETNLRKAHAKIASLESENGALKADLLAMKNRFQKGRELLREDTVARIAVGEHLPEEEQYEMSESFANPGLTSTPLAAKKGFKATVTQSPSTAFMTPPSIPEKPRSQLLSKSPKTRTAIVTSNLPTTISYKAKCPTLTSSPTVSHPAPTLFVSHKAHNFKLFSTSLCDHCDFCDERFSLGYKKAEKCGDCHMKIHPNCKFHLRFPCAPRQNAKLSGKTTLDIYDFCSQQRRHLKIPYFVIQLISAAESRGLELQKIYNRIEDDAEVRKLFQKLLSSHPFPKFEEEGLVTITECLKRFLKVIRPSVIPEFMLAPFLFAANSKDNDEIREAVRSLEDARRHTLAYLCLHFQRVLRESEVNQMDLESLAKCVGPLLMGKEKWNEKSATIMTKLLEMDAGFWVDILSV
ncbi:hypothetical protein L596_025885 [Steinernema carpocapsae]|uniref:Rho-GAP domain-containing protein n=1 Tax=Steinernema carpocapsae TaxID=34508 RepID=A0A4U5M920_STECR|nr:hypothetical protein L596_025885 [Steinernema carpocapsae]